MNSWTVRGELLRRLKLCDNMLLFTAFKQFNMMCLCPASDCTPEHNAGVSRPPWLHHEQLNLKGHDLIFEKEITTQGFFFFFFYKRLFSRENKKVAVLLGIKRKLKDLSVSDQNEFCKTTQCTFKINCPSVPICQTPLPPPLDPFDYNSTTTTSSLISGHLTTPKNTYL